MIHLGMYLSYNSSQDVRGSLLEDFLEVSFFLRRARRRGQLISYIGYWHLLEEEMTTHFSILAGIIPQTEEPGRLQFMGLQREVAQLCPTLCNPVDHSLPGFSVHGILQARILEWVTVSFSRGSSRPRDRSWVSSIGGRHFNL